MSLEQVKCGTCGKMYEDSEFAVLNECEECTMEAYPALPPMWPTDQPPPTQGVWVPPDQVPTWRPIPLNMVHLYRNLTTNVTTNTAAGDTYTYTITYPDNT